MKIRLNSLVLTFRKSIETIKFSDVTYFHGKMGAGKSSIARLIDYCLGGSLDPSPALQSEFVTADLYLSLADIGLHLFRQHNSDSILAEWSGIEGDYSVVLPARKAAGEVIPGSGVEVLSDLFFYLVGAVPPKVRRSKLRDDSGLQRLSLRDLLWYCYLDQDTIDSEFFHLESGADYFKRLKSLDVLRYILGFHQEQVAELELRLQDLRVAKSASEQTARALSDALFAAGVGTLDTIRQRQDELAQRIQLIRSSIAETRVTSSGLRNDVAEKLRARGKLLEREVEAIDEAVTAVSRFADEDRRHANELVTLNLKAKRSVLARAVLNGVEFEVCPRCAQSLPPPQPIGCRLCGQSEELATADDEKAIEIERDTAARVAELREMASDHDQQLRSLLQRRGELIQNKVVVDEQLSIALSEYDSAYLATALQLERDLAACVQEQGELGRLAVLPQRVVEETNNAAGFARDESEVRTALRLARKNAESDTTNLNDLEAIFRDCLVRSKIPGFGLDDVVEIRPPNFLPRVYAPTTGDMLVTSFDNLSSGGKKTLYKCCFAVAIHRIAEKIGANLPTILIIDSPMKNISERENREQFEGFHDMLYQFLSDELRGTQLIFVDKEYWAPQGNSGLEFSERQMTPDDPKYPPLIPYYRGH